MLLWHLGLKIRVSLLAVLCTLCGCMYVSDFSGEEASAKVTFLDVGQGLAVLLEYDGRYAMFDAGPDSMGVMDSLRARGVDTLQWVVASHYHRDHVGGLFELEAGAGTSAGARISRPVVTHLYVGLDTAGGFVRDSLFRLVRRFNIPVDTIARGDELALGNLHLKSLWPPEFISLGGNESSIVLEGRLAIAEGSFLLTGDLDSASERRLMELSPSLRTNLLQVPHHGSPGSSSLKFLSQLSPRYAAISVGKNNGYGHPAASVLQKLRHVIGDSAAVFRTDENGSLEFQIVPGVGIVR